MSFINTILGIPFGFIIYLAYYVTNSYGIAILIFALFVRVILFPATVMAQKNSIHLLKLQPTLNTMKRWYAGDRERLNEERYNLFKKEGYNSFLGMVPLLTQLILIMGVLQVMYRPLQHMLRLEQNVIDILVQTTYEIYGVQDAIRAQLLVLETVPKNLPIFQAALSEIPNADHILQSIMNTDLRFMGLDLGAVPSIANPSIELAVPFVATIAVLAMCLLQCKISPGAISQGIKTNLIFITSTVAFSIYFTSVTPTGFGVYWAIKSLLGIASLLLLNVMYNPRKLAGDAIEEIKKYRKTPEELKKERIRNKELSVWEKRDIGRFREAKKQLVFYALTAGQYKYYKEVIDYLLANTDITIHYLTNDPKDRLFEREMEGLVPYYASQRKTISLLLRLDCDMMITTVSNLQKYHMKRSIVRNDIEYCFIPHGLASGHLVARDGSLDYFDTIFCVGPHRVNEARRREELAGLEPRNLVKAGSGIYDQLVKSYAEIAHIENEKPKILIAPSWQEDNIMDLCIEEMLESLLGNGYNIIVRPHPQYINMFPERIKSLTKQYEKYTETDELTFGLDFFDNQSIFLSDVVISDWSNIAFEFSYSTLKPAIFINTPMKVLNPNYKEYNLEVLDITLRDRVGISVDLENIGDLKGIVSKLLTEKEIYKGRIEQVVSQYLFYPGRNGEACGRYIINQLEKR